MGKVLAVCISKKRGTKKTQVPYIDLKVNHGILTDAHAGNWHRQVSLLAQESVNKMISLGLDLKAGDFAENIVTSGIELKNLPIGTTLSVGEAKLRVTQIGKKCHSDCEIKKLTGKCVMPTEGIFAEVVMGGRVKAFDDISVCGDINEVD